MKAIELGRFEPNTPEWDGLRSRGLGGSEIAAVVGLSPWQSRFSLWHLKRGTLPKQEVNAGMRWGTLLEPIICDYYASQQDLVDVLPASTYRHHEREWQIANPDRMLSDDETGIFGILEVKTASAFDAHEWGRGPEDIPPYYRCQALWYLDALELSVCRFAVLIGGSDYREYEIAYNAEEAKWLRDQGEEFWHSVTSGEAPGLDGSDATYEAVRKLHPEINGETVEIDPALHEWFQSTKKAAEAAQTEHVCAKATLLDAMGQARYAEADGVRVYRRQPNRSGVSLVSMPPFRGDKTTTNVKDAS